MFRGTLGASIHPDPGEPSQHQEAHDVEGVPGGEEAELAALALASTAGHAARLDALVHACAWADPLAAWPCEVDSALALPRTSRSWFIIVPGPNLKWWAMQRLAIFESALPVLLQQKMNPLST